MNAKCKIKVAGFNSAKGQFQTTEFIWDKIGKECGHSTVKCHSELRYESFFRFLVFTSE